eukprot:5867551-Amphidinium_carterae.1
MLLRSKEGPGNDDETITSGGRTDVEVGKTKQIWSVGIPSHAVPHENYQKVPHVQAHANT